LEVRLAVVEQDLKNREVALTKEGDERLASLQGALAEEQERLKKAQGWEDDALERLQEAERVKDDGKRNSDPALEGNLGRERGRREGRMRVSKGEIEAEYI
jgi:hypothetical protein